MTFTIETNGAEYKGNVWLPTDTDKKEEKRSVQIDRPIPEVIYVNLIKRTTSVVWKDGTSTVVHCTDIDLPLDKDGNVDVEKFQENGFKSALARKIYGHYPNYARFMKRVVLQQSKPKKVKESSVKPYELTRVK